MTPSPTASRGARKWKGIALAILACVAIAALAGLVNMAGTVDDSAKLETINKMYEEYRADFPGVPSVTPGELSEMLGQHQAVLVGVREDYERAVSWIPDSITADEFEASAEDYRDMKVVIYCTVGSRSGKYASGLREQGFDAYNLKGGVLAWAHAGYDFRDETRLTKLVHTYGRKWALLPQGYEGVY